jgi:hypothetical protein
VKCYRIKARPFWDHWQVATDFSGSTLTLGGALTGTAGIILELARGGDPMPILTIPAATICAGLALQAVGLRAHALAMNGKEHEGAVSHYIQTTTFGKTYVLRNALLGFNMLLGFSAMFSSTLMLSLTSWALLMTGLLVTSLVGRALFYVLVVPTTMPGAFFWKNKGFEEHARDIGLAALPQVGVVRLNH